MARLYPAVTLLTYPTTDPEVPTFVRRFLKTVLTVPVLAYVLAPNAKVLILKAGRKCRGEDGSGMGLPDILLR